jgi:hypothetical protein
MAEKHTCEKCSFRKRYDDNPESLLGRIWHWHAGWCPGFRRYITALPDEQRIELARHYKLKKYAEQP